MSNLLGQTFTTSAARQRAARDNSMIVAEGSRQSAGLEAGWDELARGRWQAARERFESAAEGGDPEACEGLSWAAWWLDDAETVFASRERAFGLYRERGDGADAARMAAWLACDELDFHGAVAVAGGWLERARRLLDPLEPGPEHGWLAFLEGYLARVAGDDGRALKGASEAAELGRSLGVIDLEMLGLALEGSVLVAGSQVQEGLRCLDEASTAALTGESEIPISGAWACCFLVSSCTAIRDYDRALQWCDRIAEFADRWGSRYMLAFCRAEYGVVYLWQGRWEEAEDVLEASIEDFSQSRPAMVSLAQAQLAELRRRQGREREAEELIESAGPVAEAQLCAARIALDRGDPRRAADLTERLLRQLPEGSEVARAPAIELLIRARIEAGDLDRARSSLDGLLEIVALAETLPLSASAAEAEGLIAAASGEHERARVLLEDAIDGYQRAGGRFEEARARIELGKSLIALARAEDGERELVRAQDELGELGAGPEIERIRGLLGDAGDGPRSALAELTPRETEVLGRLAEGLTNREIAERLVISEHTVHRHVTNILRKLELPSRTAAAALAVRSGLFDASAE